MALFVLAFESITIVVDPVGDKFIDIEEGDMAACVLWSRKTLELSFNCKLRGLVFKIAFHSRTVDVKIMRERHRE